MIHPSDMELQQYALDKSSCSKEAIGHIALCEGCQVAIKLYQLMVVEIKGEPSPAFDFDLSALVLSKLSGKLMTKEAHAERFGFSSWLIALLTCCTIGIPFYLFRKNMLNVFEGISVLFMYIIVAAAAIIVLIRIMDMYRKYQQQVRSLNYY
jgi:hypothetical protein